MAENGVPIKNALMDKARGQSCIAILHAINTSIPLNRIKISRRKCYVYVGRMEYDIDKLKRDPLVNARIFSELWRYAHDRS